MSARSASSSGRDGDIGEEPRLFDAHMEEVRSGHSEEPERFHADPVGGASSWGPRIAELGTRYPTAVLSIVSPDGFPFALRVPIRVDGARRWIKIDGAPDSVPLQPGLACLTAHQHAPDFTWQQNFQLRGDLVYVRTDGRWSRTSSSAASSFRPRKLAVMRVKRRQGPPLPTDRQARARAAQLMAAPAERITVAVTGPTGDIGRSLLRALERSREVERIVAMARRPFDPRAAGLRKTEYRQGDVLDRNAIEELVAPADVVVHLAFVIMGSPRRDPRRSI